MFIDELIDSIKIWSDGVWCYLLIVANDNRLFAHIESSQRFNVCLACFVDDHNIKAIAPRVKILHNAAQGHDPYGDGCLAFRYQFTCFRQMVSSHFTCTFTHLTYMLFPTLEG